MDGAINLEVSKWNNFNRVEVKHQWQKSKREKNVIFLATFPDFVFVIFGWSGFGHPDDDYLPFFNTEHTFGLLYL